MRQMMSEEAHGVAVAWDRTRRHQDRNLAVAGGNALWWLDLNGDWLVTEQGRRATHFSHLETAARASDGGASSSRFTVDGRLLWWKVHDGECSNNVPVFPRCSIRPQLGRRSGGAAR
jgi:hypothetical protein